MAHDRVLLDVAGAVVSSEGVDWARARRAARPDQRRALDNLRALSGVFAGAGSGSLERLRAVADPIGTAFARLAFGALVAVAALHVAGSLVTIAWSWDRAMDVPFAVPRVLSIVSFLLCAVLLLVGGRLDHRARLMGAVFLVIASSFWAPFAGIGWILPETLLPALMWAFAREFPRAARRTRLDELARLAVPLSAAIGTGLWIANLPPVIEWLPYLGRRHVVVYWAIVSLLALPALAAIAWRARDAVGDESKRARLLIAGILIGVAPIPLDVVIETLWPAARRFGDDHRVGLGIVVYTFLLSMPFSVTWAVLAKRALDVRTVVRASYRRLLTRRLLAAATAAPLAALGWTFFSQPDRTVEAVIATPGARLSVAALGAAALATVCRRRLLVHLDAWVFPETQDHGRLLSAAGSELMQAATVSRVGEVVAETVRRACGAPATMMTLAETVDAYTGPGTVPSVAAPPLPRASAVAFMLESARQPILVDPHDPASVFHLLPASDAGWVVATEAAAVAPVPGPGTELDGLLVVGRRLDDRPLSPEALEFVRTMGSTAGLAAARLRSALSSRSPFDAPPAGECPVCGLVAKPGDGDGRQACGCGADYVQALVPSLLAGKFRLERRLGAGGMGVVYLAQDADLHRHVAVKTLPVAAVQGLVRLRREGRAMAAMAHPAIAQIHGVETWRGRPLLVVEYLAGGTLAARLDQGPLSDEQAVGIAITVAEALTALHDAGYVHGDVKPSNVGFASVDGAVKLLDFGLARLAEDGDGLAGGTVPYLSPEVLRGAPAGAADDVWALCVVLHEMLTGTRPFAGGSAKGLADRIRRQRMHLPLSAGVEAAGRRAHSFVVSILTAAVSARPASARAFANALRRL